MAQKKRAVLVEEAEKMGLDVPPASTHTDIIKQIDRAKPATEDQMILGEALLKHPRSKELRKVISMKDACWRENLTKEAIEEATVLLKQLGLPVPK